MFASLARSQLYLYIPKIQVSYIYPRFKSVLLMRVYHCLRIGHVLAMQLVEGKSANTQLTQGLEEGICQNLQDRLCNHAGYTCCVAQGKVSLLFIGCLAI